MLADSGLLQDLQRFANSPVDNPFCLYSDPAYPHRIYLQTPFPNRAPTDPMIAFNQSMSTKWLFNDIVNYFKFMDFKKNLKISLRVVGKMYVICAILRNALKCLYPNQT